MNKSLKELDKYYTKSKIAKDCYDLYKKVLDSDEVFNRFWIEPSAGSGRILDVITESKIGFDISPDNDFIIQNDFIKNSIWKYVSDKNNRIIFGNPPFGNKGDLAVKFINKGFEYSDYVGFILPNQFRKWSTQSKILSGAQLILDTDLQDNSFTFDGKDYDLRSCFQIWSVGFTIHKDLRLLKSPKIKHDDFECYQYNRTEESLKYFDYDWDIAIPRQGFNEYKLFYKKEDCDKKKQWIFIKARKPEYLEILKNIDYDQLSKKNSIIPGFGKADLVEEYTRIKNGYK